MRYVNVLEGLQCEQIRGRASESLDGSIEGEPTRGHGDISGLGWTLQMVNKLEDVIVEKFG